MSDRQNIGSGTPWERLYGYSRAVRVGQVVYVAGTVASDAEGHVVGPNDPEAQARFIFQKIERTLNEAGATLGDVVRTRMLVTDIRYSDTFGRVHGEFFADIRPAATMIEISALIGPDYFIEVEVEAIIQTC